MATNDPKTPNRIRRLSLARDKRLRGLLLVSPWLIGDSSSSSWRRSWRRRPMPSRVETSENPFPEEINPRGQRKFSAVSNHI
jgi:hypothetical protein